MTAPPDSPPLVSIIIPAYQSEATLEASLQSMLAQTYPHCEIIVVDSTPDAEAAGKVLERLPGVKLIRSEQRLLPHAARNRGVRESTGSLLLFTDPDIYAPPDWVRLMVEAYHRRGGVVAGAVDCFGGRWWDRSVHVCKFDPWLPGGPARRIGFAPTANLLCDRATFETVGEFVNHFNGDTVWCWAAARRTALWFEPQARVLHHHHTSWGRLLRERYERGREYAALRARYEQWRLGRILLYGLAGLPLGLVRVLARALGNSVRAGQAGAFLAALPVVAVGQAAWLAGETTALLKILAKRIIVAPLRHKHSADEE